MEVQMTKDDGCSDFEVFKEFIAKRWVDGLHQHIMSRKLLPWRQGKPRTRTPCCTTNLYNGLELWRWLAFFLHLVKASQSAYVTSSLPPWFCSPTAYFLKFGLFVRWFNNLKPGILRSRDGPNRLYVPIEVTKFDWSVFPVCQMVLVS